MNKEIFDALHGYYLEDIKIGQTAVVSKTITEADVLLFSAVSGDDNPLHMNREFAQHTRFNERIVHGMLTTSLWSNLVGTRLPGPGCAYMGQEINFLKPVRIGDTVTAQLTVTRVDKERQRVYLDATAMVGDLLVANGETRTWVPRRPTS
ncbi:MAG: MaoC family dehydratase [Gammaproteobacteria bacterium]|nr:MaoC family dehydratase [Gammaproteobacteria bacterium]